jgi:hypothetical protein
MHARRTSYRAGWRRQREPKRATSRLREPHGYQPWASNTRLRQRPDASRYFACAPRPAPQQHKYSQSRTLPSAALAWRLTGRPTTAAINGLPASALVAIEPRPGRDSCRGAPSAADAPLAGGL